MNNYYNQSGYSVKVEWGQRGAREAAQRGDIIVIVDVLSYSSTVAAALHHGAQVYPFPPPNNEKAKEYAASLGAEMVLGRAEAERTGGYTLSPVSFKRDDRDRKFVLCSLNGAACTEAAKAVPALLIGSLVNADVAAKAAHDQQKKTGRDITIVPCGEQWEDPHHDENGMRPGIEDYLGAGAILASLEGTFSPEAEVCAASFAACQHNLEQLITQSGSGRELVERGYGADVEFCRCLNTLEQVPVLYNGCFVNYSSFLTVK
ncbi:2-phosphosulfolactate phosphatase [Fictibacillus iocasae]|uniref:Probable 2-phosphosulfolactate phosphatase n=1 Tax=Fictibacillus iocasae TaxID=2715437 RepID=A0ABW2NP28_9BACL